MKNEITEEKALSLMANDDGSGLRWFIQHYTPYVSTIVYNIIGEYMTPQDVEEVASDVFFALWKARERLRPETVKGYLAATARARAINKLREQGWELTVEEDTLTIPADDPAQVLEDAERDWAVREAVHSMDPPDNEILVRYYYYCQTVGKIAVTNKSVVYMTAIETRIGEA